MAVLIIFDALSEIAYSRIRTIIRRNKGQSSSTKDRKVEEKLLTDPNHFATEAVG